MSDSANTVGIITLFLAVVAMAVGLTVDITKGAIVDDCKTFNGFKVGNKMFKCELIKDVKNG